VHIKRLLVLLGHAQEACRKLTLELCLDLAVGWVVSDGPQASKLGSHFIIDNLVEDDPFGKELLLFTGQVEDKIDQRGVQDLFKVLPRLSHLALLLVVATPDRVSRLFGLEFLVRPAEGVVFDGDLVSQVTSYAHEFAHLEG